MTSQEVIDIVKRLKPNAYSDEICFPGYLMLIVILGPILLNIMALM